MATPPYACLADALFHVDQACASLAKDTAGGLAKELGAAVGEVRTILVRELHHSLAGAAHAPAAPVPPPAEMQLLRLPGGPSLGAKTPGPRAVGGDCDMTPSPGPKLGAFVSDSGVLPERR
jgi:hypothetical protein